MDSDRQLQRLDLNLLLAFDALITECNVTRAAARLAVGQPAMSASLARLRKFFGDPLLVREGRGLRPTHTALELAVPIRAALDSIESAVRATSEFNPRSDQRTFTVMASDYALLILLCPLLAELEDEAPNLQLNVQPTTGDFADRLNRSQLDLLVCPTERATGGIESRTTRLFSDRLMCVVDRNHPDIGDRITEEQFRTLPYVTYYNGGDPTISELRFRALGIQRPVDVYTQSWVIQPLMLPGTRFITLLPERLANHFAAHLGLRLLEPPYRLEPLTEAMYWSSRTDADPAHRWLRERVQHAAAKMER
ncbi:LysR family transcriptional regulator [Streptomyces fulvoviolaceus]|uniref:LysR family transcriptional regulator n=1 Tax=Streptomyces fulvoviolaceus TaxID=285535 RepID=UPI0004C8FEBE|nr:LysR family transcriptional regulator [Streptomyces fulvoviolaceus]